MRSALAVCLPILQRHAAEPRENCFYFMNNTGLQALKTLSCFAAVTFYSASNTCSEQCFIEGNVLSVLYFLSIIATPLFFMINGYIDSSSNLNNQGVVNKIKSILVIVLFWNLLFYFISEEGFKQGYFLQSWLLFSIAAIYLINPFIASILRDNRKTLWVIGILILFSVSIDLISTLSKKAYLVDFPQYFRLWTWVLYYMIGRLLGSEQCREITRRKGIRILARACVIPIAVSMYFYESTLSIEVYKTINAGYFLDNLHVLLLSLSIFIVFDNFNTENRLVKSVLGYISPAMIGVYILHDGVFYFISSAYDFNELSKRLLLLLLVFFASVLLSRALLLNKYTSRFVSF